MQINGQRYCDICSIIIDPCERDRVELQQEDYHNVCWRRALNNYFATKRVLARQDSFMASERPMAEQRLMGG